MHRTRNAAYGQPYRGFESLPLRQYPRVFNNLLFDGPSVPYSVPGSSRPLDATNMSERGVA